MLATATVHNSAAAMIVSIDVNYGHYIDGEIHNLLGFTWQHEIKKYVQKALDEYKVPMHSDIGMSE